MIRVGIAGAIAAAALVSSGCFSTGKGGSGPGPETGGDAAAGKGAGAVAAQTVAPNPAGKKPVAPKPKEKPVTPATPSPLEAALQRLVSEDAEQRSAARSEIDQMSPDALPGVLAAFGHAEAAVRQGAAYYLLERFDASDPEQVAAFSKALEDSDRTVRHLALQVMMRSKSLMADRLPQIAALVADDTVAASNREKAVRALATLGEQARPALPQITATANSNSPAKVRAACVFAVSRIADKDEATRVLTDRLLKDKDAAVRHLAAARLGRVGTAAAAEPLCKALEDSVDKVRRTAARALARVGEPAVDPLVQRLASQHATVRRLAVYALGNIGGRAKRSLPELQKRLKDDDEQVRKLAEFSIRVIRSQ